MTFLNPLVLLGLVAAVIPLIIHLFNFRRPRRIDFSTLVFLRELRQTTMKRMRVKQWLLLLLRAAALICLVAAFARPTLTGSLAGLAGGDAESASVIVLDNSLSMTARDENGSFLEQARRLAAQLPLGMATGDEMAVITTSGDWSGEDRLSANRSFLLDRIEGIEREFAVRTVSEAVMRGLDVLGNARQLNKEIFVLSDFQSSTVGDTLPESLPADIVVRLVPVGRDSRPNLAVTSVEVESRIVEENRPVRVSALVSGFGAIEAATYLSGLYLDGERLAQATVETGPSARSAVSFVVTPRRTGWLAGYVEVEADPLEEDNLRFFALHVPERRKVLLVKGAGATDQYVSLALSDQLAGGRSPIEVEHADEAGLSSADVASFDAVLLLAPSQLATAEIGALARYVGEGGGLFLFPPSRPDESGVNALLGALSAGRFEGATDAEGVTVVTTETEHPLFEGIFEHRAEENRPEPERPEVYRFAPFEKGSAEGQTLMRLSTDHPFLEEVRCGAGRLLVASVQPDPSWSDLPVRGLFVPLLYRALQYLSSSETATGDDVIIGRLAEIRLREERQEAQVHVEAGSGPIVPEQRPVFGGLLVTLDGSFARPGVYDVVRGEQLLRRVSANIDARESDLTRVTADEAAEILRGDPSADIASLALEEMGPGALSRAVTVLRRGKELWNVFLLLALAFLLAEMIVARQWRPEAAVT